MKALACLFTLLATLTYAETVTVTVGCTNGALVRGLAIDVIDNQRTHVSGISRTDGQGQFVIENSQLYTAPFYMGFKAPDGSMCGWYYIQPDSIDPTLASVTLQYYPITNQCSCSQFTP